MADSGSGVGVTVAAQFVAAILISAWRRDGRKERAISLWAGGLFAPSRSQHHGSPAVVAAATAGALGPQEVTVLCSQARLRLIDALINCITTQPLRCGSA